MADFDWLGLITDMMGMTGDSTGGSTSSGGSSDIMSMMGGGDNSGMMVYDKVLNGMSSLLGTIGDYYEQKNQEEYQDQLNAYKREMERIAGTNKARQERAKARSQVQTQMGGGMQQRAPKMINTQGMKAPLYRPDQTAEYMKQGQKLIKGWQNLTSGMGQSGGGTTTAKAPAYGEAEWMSDIAPQIPQQYSNLPTSSGLKTQSLTGGYLQP